MRRTLSIPVLLMLASGLCAAQQEEPGRGVARVSLMNGDITIGRGDSGDWVAAAVNAPLVAGDKIFAARASRAEVQFDRADFLRLGENTEVRMADLDNQRYQLQVSRGLLTFRQWKGSEAQVEIDTPGLAIRPLKPGIYRVEVLENGETQITVREGKAEIASRQRTETIGEGRTLLARAGPTDNDVEVQELQAAARDNWDQWNERRDQQLTRSRSYQYVPQGVYGAEDLDDYGSWAPVPGYGPTWFPRVDAGWAPYSYGRWAWVDWYGWTWVDYDPWGWAPFHYGRWFWRAGFGWGWCPGPIYAPVYWSPALVGFFGWGGHGGFGVGFGFGNIGWVPLAPGERFYPWYGRGFYGRRNNVFVDNSVHITNITNVTNIRNVYRNANVNGGVLSANVQDFSHGRLAHVQHVNVTEIHSAGQIRGVVPVVPDRASLRVSDREVRPGSVPVAAHYDNRFFTRTQSRPVERVPFAEQQQQLTRSFHGQAGPAAQQVNRSPAPAAATGSVRPTAPAPTNPSRSWRRIGEERPPAANAALSAPLADERKAQQDTSGRRLGDGQQAPAAAPAPAPSNYRNADRNSGSRRFGEETRPAPAAAPSAPSPERNAERDSGSRRFGQADHQAAPSRPPAQNYQPRQETPRMERRPLELNRPIVRERAPQHGGGGRSSAPPPRSSGRDSERSSDHGGRGRR